MAQNSQALEFHIDTCIHCSSLIRGDHKIKIFARKSRKDLSEEKREAGINDHSVPKMAKLPRKRSLVVLGSGHEGLDLGWNSRLHSSLAGLENICLGAVPIDHDGPLSKR